MFSDDIGLVGVARVMGWMSRVRLEYLNIWPFLTLHTPWTYPTMFDVFDILTILLSSIELRTHFVGYHCFGFEFHLAVGPAI